MASKEGIRVNGLDKHLINVKQIQMYFRKPSNGGGKISKIYYPLLHNDAVIVFENPDTVDKILSISKHMIQGSEVKITRLPPMVFTTIDARLEPDTASIVLATDIRDELEYWADVRIIENEQDQSCILRGDYYQIERAWEIINLAMGRQKKIQYRLQQQLSTESSGEKTRPRHRPQGKSTDMDNDSDSDSDGESALKRKPISSSHSARKFQDSILTNSVVSVTDSIISQTPFEDDIVKDVRQMGQRVSPAGYPRLPPDDSDEEMYTSHRYQQQRKMDRDGSSRYKTDTGNHLMHRSEDENGGHSSFRAGTNRGGYLSERSESMQRGSSSYRPLIGTGDSREKEKEHSVDRSGVRKGDSPSHMAEDERGVSPYRTTSPSDASITHSSGGRPHVIGSHLSGTAYDNLFPKVEHTSSYQRPEVLEKGNDVDYKGSKTYTVTSADGGRGHNSHSLLDDVHMDSDDSDETILKSANSYQLERYQDQNNTFDKFSQISIRDQSDVGRTNGEVSSVGTAGLSDFQGTKSYPRQTPSHVEFGSSNSHVKGLDDMFNSSAHRQMSEDQNGDRMFSSLPPRTTLDQNGSSDHFRHTSYISESNEAQKNSHSDRFASPSHDPDLEKAISASLQSSGHAENFPVLNSYEFNVGEIKVVIYRGNITEVKTSGIVNAANGYLAHGAGIAGAIAMAAGPSMQQECEELKKKYGALETATVVHTQAGGKLPREVTYILHAVGPIWIEAIKGRCTFELILTYLNCFRYADKIWLDSVSLPCISAGIFGCPLDVSIQSFLDGLLVFHSELVSSSHLREVHLVNNDPDGVITSIVLIKSLLDNGLDNAIAQSLERYEKLSKAHGGAIRLTKTLVTPKIRSKDDDVVKSKTGAEVKKPARRSNSLQRTARKSPDTGTSGPDSSRTQFGSSSSAFKNIGSNNQGSVSRERQSLRDKSATKDRPSSASRSRDLGINDSRYESPRTSRRDSPSENGITSRSSATSKTKVIDRFQSSRGDSSSVTNSRGASSSKATPQLKQALVSTGSGARPKSTHTRQEKTTPIKATTLRMDNGRNFGDNRHSSAVTREYLEGSQSLPFDFNRPSGIRTRGSSPRRYMEHK